MIAKPNVQCLVFYVNEGSQALIIIRMEIMKSVLFYLIISDIPREKVEFGNDDVLIRCYNNQR